MNEIGADFAPFLCGPIMLIVATIVLSTSSSRWAFAGSMGATTTGYMLFLLFAGLNPKGTFSIGLALFSGLVVFVSTLGMSYFISFSQHKTWKEVIDSTKQKARDRARERQNKKV